MRAATAADAAAAGDIVVVTIPLLALREVPVDPLCGKVVIDTNTYYPQRDGHIAALDDGSPRPALRGLALPAGHPAYARLYLVPGSSFPGHGGQVTAEALEKALDTAAR